MKMKNYCSIMTPTLNKMGYMFSDLTIFDEEFISFSKKSKGPVLEIGAAYGVSTLKVAKSGVKIVANDLEKEHLIHLEKKATKKASEFITLCPGRFPTEIDFPQEIFTAVLASNVFHYLKGDEVIDGIKKIFAWLKPNGKVYIIAGTPYAYQWHEFIPSFEEKISRGIKWPGYVTDFSIFKHNKRFEQLPKFMHFFCPTILSSLFEENGFVIEKAEFCSRPKWPDDMQLDGRESAGLIARKRVNKI